MQYRYHHNELEPRIPRGRHGGGQWTRDGDAAGQPAFLEAAGRIAAQAAPTIFQRGLAAATALFAMLSAYNSRNRRAVVTFRAREFEGDNGKMIGEIQLLNREQVKAACTSLADVQKMTDWAATATKADIEKDGLSLTPGQYGTAVHYKLKQIVEKSGDVRLSAEKSYVKNEQERTGRTNDYGEKESIRIDVEELASEKMVCVYDIKTGRSNLGPKRMREIAARVLAKNPKVDRIQVIEVRPFQQ